MNIKMITFVHTRSRILLLVCCFPACIQAHARFKCPSPRSSDTGIKIGPCGDQTNDFSFDAIEIAPGPMRIEIEESISHTGAPFRISLSSDGSDDDICVLLDHIPHNDNPSFPPRFYDESTYAPYVITIEIPDVYCEKCSLRMANPMTDKIQDDGAPSAQGCTDPNGTCSSVYHSCTVPLKITGSIPRNQLSCPAPLPDDWPLEWIGDDGFPVDASTPGVYRRQSSEWVNGFLQTVPERYRAEAGICSKSQSTNNTSQDEVTMSPSVKPAEDVFPTPANNDLNNAIASASTTGGYLESSV
jgi:hypothetical protein